MEARKHQVKKYRAHRISRGTGKEEVLGTYATKQEAVAACAAGQTRTYQCWYEEIVVDHPLEGQKRACADSYMRTASNAVKDARQIARRLREAAERIERRADNAFAWAGYRGATPEQNLLALVEEVMSELRSMNGNLQPEAIVRELTDLQSYRQGYEEAVRGLEALGEPPWISGPEETIAIKLAAPIVSETDERF